MTVAGAGGLSTLHIGTLNATSNSDKVIVSVPGLTSGGGTVLTYQGSGAFHPTFVPQVDSNGMVDISVVDDHVSDVDATLTDQSTMRGFLGQDADEAAQGYWTQSLWLENGFANPGYYPHGTNARAWFNDAAAVLVSIGTHNVTLDASVIEARCCSTARTRLPSCSGGTQTITLQTTIAADTQIQSVAGTSSVAPDILMAAGDPIISVASGSALTLSGVRCATWNPAHPASLTINGAGTLILSGANTYAGTTTLSAGVLNFQNQNALQNSTFAGGAGSLVFDASVGGHAFTFGGLTGTSGIVLQDNAASPNAVALSVGNNGGTTAFSGVLSGSGSLTKIGSGALTLTAANTYAGLTTVKLGTLKLTAPAFDAVLNTTGTARGANIQGGYLVFDYSATGVSPADTIRANLAASYAAGSGSLISGPMYTSTGSALGYGIGYSDNTTAKTVTAQVAVYGDANLDGTVNILDLAALGQNWKQTGRHWADGDFNYDGTVNLLDLAILGQHWKQSLTGISFGQAAASAGFGTIPEPGTLMLLACCLFGLLAYAWRKRK